MCPIPICKKGRTTGKPSAKLEKALSFIFRPIVVSKLSIEKLQIELDKKEASRNRRRSCGNTLLHLFDPFRCARHFATAIQFETFVKRKFTCIFLVFFGEP